MGYRACYIVSIKLKGESAVENIYSGKYIKFQDICDYIEKEGNSKLKSATKHLFANGLVLLPSIFTKYSGDYSQCMSFFDTGSRFLEDIATGATLVGAGISTIVGDALKDLFKKNSDYQETYVKMQTAYYMCFYASFFEAIEEKLVIEGIDNFFSEFVNGISIGQEMYLNLGDDCELNICFNSTEDIKEGYIELTTHFEKSFFAFDNIQVLVEESEEQKCYFVERIRCLPDIAIKKFTQQIVQLVIEYPKFQSWLSVRFYTELKDQFVHLPNTIAEHLSENLIDKYEKRQVLRKELFSRFNDSFFYLFGDEQCEVEDVFTLNHYTFAELCGGGLKQKVNNIHEIMNMVKKQRYLLISGPYGSGKTTLIKKLYLEYRRKSQDVYAFDAKDLMNIANDEIEFENFFNSICDKEAIIIIDSLDDLNIPNAESAEKSLLEYFIVNMLQFLKKNRKISFVLASREYAFVYDDSEESVSEKIFIYDSKDDNKKMIESGSFKSEDISTWIDNYPFKRGEYVDKKTIKEQNGKIVNALKNPLFLYAFIKQCEVKNKIESHEGYYYYYEQFIEQTIQGKYREESLLGANVISDNTGKYRELVQRIAYDILKIHSNRIRSIVDPMQISEEHPLLDDVLQKYKFWITYDEFSEATTLCFEELKSESIDKANFLNCYFLKAIDKTVFFTDVNILFTLASDRIFKQFMEISQKEIFDITDLNSLDVIDFYPQVIDYIIYKLRNCEKQRKIRSYLRSFVLNIDIRNRIDASGKSKKEICETFAQILMLYILFFKFNKNNLSSEYNHVFKEMMYYVNAYKTFSYRERPQEKVYTVERYFMRNILDEIILKRINLKFFNFKDSVINNAHFIQCKFGQTIFNDSEIKGKNIFDLCDFKEAELMFTKSTQATELIFRDCRITKMLIKPQQNCRFVRCFIKELRLNLHNLKSMFFENCVIEKIIVEGEKSSSRAIIIFDLCSFSTSIDLSGYEGRILVKTKCTFPKEGHLFKGINPERIKGIHKII